MTDYHSYIFIYAHNTLLVFWVKTESENKIKIKTNEKC